MKRLISFCRTYPKLITWSVAIAVALAGGVLGWTGQCLNTELTSKGIVSLELAWKQEKAERIRAEWDTTHCKTHELSVESFAGHGKTKTGNSLHQIAKQNIVWDIPFIVFYTLLFVMLIIRKDEGEMPGSPLKKITKTFIALAICTGVLDLTENFFMWIFLDGADVVSISFALPATLKFLFVLTLILYILFQNLIVLSAFGKSFMVVLWRNRVSVIGLIVMYLALWFSDQGQDLLLNLNAHFTGPLFFYIILSVLAVVNWFLPKYYSNSFIGQIPEGTGIRFLLINPHHQMEGNETNVPRLMGSLTFLIPACCILHALQAMQIQYFLDFIPPALLLTCIILLYIRITDKDLIREYFNILLRKDRDWIVHLTISIMLCLIMLFGFLNKGAPHHLTMLSIGLFFMSLMFLMITSLRRVPEFYQLTAFTKVLEWMRSQYANRWVLGVASLSILIFVIFNFIPVRLATLTLSRFVTLPVIFTGISFYTVSFFILLIVGKYSKINWAGFLIILGIVTAVFLDNKFHDLHLVDRNPKSDLKPLKEYIHEWILARQDSILNDSTSRYPVFIVNAYGGGIRAASWTSLVVSHLDSATSGGFQRHVLAYSGASGGTIGSSIMCTLRKAHDGRPVMPQQIVEFYKNDFLTPILIGLLGRDIFFSISGWDAIDDRSRLQDKTWEKHLSPLDSGLYQEEFSSLWQTKGLYDYDVPLLLSNTYHVEGGLKGIMAPVKIHRGQFPQAVIIDDLLKGRSLSLSTGAFLSARFPYISPAARLDASHHFLDGGLKDNSGAETALELYKLVEAIRKEMEGNPTWGKFYKSIDVYFLSINNAGNNDPPATRRNLVEFTAPFTALYNNWVGNTLRADSMLRNETKPFYFQFRPRKDCVTHEGITFRPVLPLGWQISDFALQRLKESIYYGDNPGNLKKIEGLLLK